VRAEIVLDVLEPQLSPLIFSSVMKKGGNHHVFGDRAPGMASLTHDQGRNSEKMRHVRNICTLAPFDVEDTRIFDCARKPAGQVKLSARIVVWTLVFCFHSASIWIVSSISSEWNGYLKAGCAGMTHDPVGAVTTEEVVVLERTCKRTLFRPLFVISSMYQYDIYGYMAR
jgi:hypothetical protein